MGSSSHLQAQARERPGDRWAAPTPPNSVAGRGIGEAAVASSLVLAVPHQRTKPTARPPAGAVALRQVRCSAQEMECPPLIEPMTQCTLA
jgi:hypothetical protein